MRGVRDPTADATRSEVLRRVHSKAARGEGNIVTDRDIALRALALLERLCGHEFMLVVDQIELAELRSALRELPPEQIEP